jgi:hypothetical protein
MRVTIIGIGDDIGPMAGTQTIIRLTGKTWANRQAEQALRNQPQSPKVENFETVAYYRYEDSRTPFR